MISRSDFVEKMKKLKYPEEITQDDLTTAYKLFHDVEPTVRHGMMKSPEREILGLAMKQQREHAIERFSDDKPAQLPCGGTLRAQRDRKDEASQRWLKWIPDGTQKVICFQALNKLLGENIFKLLTKEVGK
jgi:hypothetical protein